MIEKMQPETVERGRHFLGVFAPGNSPVDFFGKTGFGKELFQLTEFRTCESSGLGINFVKEYGNSNLPLPRTYINQGIGVLFSGEIYNRNDLILNLEELRIREDTPDEAEIAGRLYEKYGMEFPSRINGMFSIVLIDFWKRMLILYADRFGAAWPIYYHFSGRIIFSSRLRYLLRFGNIPKEIDRESLAIFLKYSYIPTPRTMIQGVYKLGPGEFVVIKDQQLRKERYSHFETTGETVLDQKSIVEVYTEKLKSSIQKKMEGFDPGKVGFFLSGGLDSSANVAFASMIGSRSFKTFGIGFKDPQLDERPYAKLVAHHFDVKFFDSVFEGSEIEYLPKIVWYLDEPFMENGLFLTFAGFRAAQGNVDLIIGGDGADQLFGTGGFAKGRPIALRYLFDRIGLRRVVELAKDMGLRHIKEYGDNFFFKMKVMMDRAVDFNDWFFWGFDDQELKQLCRVPISREGMRCFSNDIDKVPRGFNSYYQYALIHQDIEHYVSQNVLIKSYRMAEMFGMNLRETYLDNEVIDFLVPLDVNLKTGGSLMEFLRGNRVTKYLHRLAVKDLLPAEILKKPKQGGFIPMTILLADPIRRKAIFGYVSRSKYLEEYLNMDVVTHLLDQYETLVMKKMYWQPYHDCKVNQIMNLLVLSLWHDICFSSPCMISPESTLSQYIFREGVVYD